MIQAILALIVSYLGLSVGKYLSKAAKEEIETGKDNLLIFQKLLAFLILILFFFTAELPIKMFPFEKLWIFFFDLMALLILLAVVIFIEYDYAVFGVLFGLNPTFLMSILIFLYGFPAGSLMKGNYVKIFKKTWIYLALGLIFLIIRNYL